jgi:adenylosuccinate synthase
MKGMKMLKKGKANILIDGQFGSTGKGLLAGYIAHESDVEAEYAVTNAAPNAGHTFYTCKGTKIVAKHLPIYGILKKQCIIYLNAGAIINPKMLFEEMEQYEVSPSRVFIHPRASVITEEDIENEKQMQSPTTQLASTQSGVGSSLSRKINRYKKAIAEHHQQLSKMCGYVNLNGAMENGSTVFIETPQGVGLGINDGYQYPFCTSRNVSISNSLADAGIHPFYMGHTFLSMRTYPIRVGNLYDKNGKMIGYSGDFYQDSTETSFPKLTQNDEYTTVTQRVRRIASFSYEQYKYATDLCRPEFIFMNFMNYIKDKKERKNLLDKCEDIYKPSCWLMGYGPKLQDVTRSANNGT